jgi:L-asparaginase/Glu-tRNA(Gln) amidotransferase subunit D
MASPDLAPDPGPRDTSRTTAVLIRVYPGIDFAAHEALVEAAAAACVVLELFPSGTAPTATPDLAAFVEHCQRSRVVVVASVPSPLGGVHFPYASTIELRSLGVHVLTDVTAELLYAKAVLAPVASEAELVTRLCRPSRTERLVPVVG